MKTHYIIYHANCSDGFGSAWAAWRTFGDSAVYHPALHGSLPPDDLAGKHVIIADFCYSLAQLKKIEEVAASLTLLDHHIGVKDIIKQFTNHVFDVKRSGAGITWDFLNPGQPRPPLIDYIEDRDLWNWALPDSREVLIAFDFAKNTFADFEAFNARLEDPASKAEIVAEGKPLLKYKAQKVEYLASKAFLVDLSSLQGLDDPTLQVPCVNTPLFHSEVGNYLAKSAPIAMSYYQAEDGMYRYSLRSINKIDCSKIAQFWGGNGHANAAGFTLKVPLPAISNDSTKA